MIYANAALMGVPNVRDLSVFQWQSMIDGYNEAHAGDAKPEAPSVEEFKAAIAVW